MATHCSPLLVRLRMIYELVANVTMETRKLGLEGGMSREEWLHTTHTYIHTLQTNKQISI